MYLCVFYIYIGRSRYLKDIVDTESPSSTISAQAQQDREETQEALEGLLVTMKRRDRALAVLEQGESLKIAKDQLRPISPLRVCHV